MPPPVDEAAIGAPEIEAGEATLVPQAVKRRRRDYVV
jgi:hypothetical protein